MLMVCIEIIASDVAVTMGGAEGNFELNAFRPVLISNYLHSALIMADMCDHFREFMIEGTKLKSPRTVEYHLHKIFTKLAISSRSQLHGVLASPRKTDAGKTS
jgi:fumarate hydratase class II